MSLEFLFDAVFGDFAGVSDLNGELHIVQSGSFSAAGDRDVHWQDAVCSDHGLFAMEDLSSHCGPACRRLSRQDADLCRALPHSGLRPTHLPGESARHRGLSVGASPQALSHGYPGSRFPFHAGRCQRNTRLAHLRRVRTTLDGASQATLCQGRSWTGSDQHGLRAGLDHHRSVPVGVPVGALPYHQSRSEDAYVAGPARQHSQFHPHLRWQDARHQGARSSCHRRCG